MTTELWRMAIRTLRLSSASQDADLLLMSNEDLDRWLADRHAR
jgi:hypothetical protein